MLRVAWLVAACLLSLAAVCPARQNKLAALSQGAIRAYQAKDFTTFLALQKQILALTPGDTRAIYNTACGEAHLHHPAEAVQLLNQLLASKIDLGADKDKDFDDIRASPEWKTFQDGLAELRKPIVHSTTAFTLPDKELVATSIAVDERTGDTYIGSARERKVIRRSKDGVVSDFATSKDGLLGVWSVVVDPLRRQLIVATAAIPFMQGFTKEDEGKSGICIFDLASGKLARKSFLPDRHFLSATAVDKAGNIYVVDSATFEIYRLRRSSADLELFISSMSLHAPRGLALSDDERTLYVADYGEGIWAVEVLSNDRRLLETPPNTWTGGLNGITRVADGFVALETGIHPLRVLHIRVDEKAGRITAVDTLESNHPDYAEPLQGTVSGGDFLYVANSQVALGDLRTGTFDAAQAKPTTVLRLPIGN